MPTIVITVEVPQNFGEPGSDPAVVTVTQTEHGVHSLGGEIQAEIVTRVQKALAPPPTIYDEPLEVLGFTPRTFNCLRSGRQSNWSDTSNPNETVGQLVERTADELLHLSNFGPKKLAEVRAVLRDNKLKLRGDP